MQESKEELYQHIETLKEEYKDIIPNWGLLGFVIFIRTYARWIEQYKRHETFAEMTARVLKGSLNIGVPYDKKELTAMFKYMFEMKLLPAGRDMWQLGTKLPDSGIGDSLMNCAFLTINHYEKFVQTFDLLCKGVGVGYSVERKYLENLPIVKKVNKVEHYSMLHLLPMDEWHQFKETGILIESSDKKAINYCVADSREGYAEVLRQLFICYFETGQNLFFDTSLIRAKGMPIRGFGGKASGAEPLIEAILKIAEILNNAVGRRITSVEATAIECIEAKCVVSGNVRRSAECAISDPDDIPFMTMKRWDIHKEVPDYLSMVNISVNCENIDDLPQEFWDSYEKAGESIGLINVENCQLYGRTGDNKNLDKIEYYPQYYNYDENMGIIDYYEYLHNLKVDPNVKGCNPCFEASLPDYGVCSLAEILLPNVDNYSEFVEICKLLYKLKKHSLQLNFHNKEAENIINSESRIGIGVTGIFDSLDKIKWLGSAYRELREFDKQYSLKHNLPISAKLTVIKPSGTLSKMAGISCGAHPHYFRYGYMTIRMASNDPLWKVCRDNGYRIENLQHKEGEKIIEDKNTKVIYFPVKVADDSIISEDLSPIKHLEYVKTLQQEWCDQSVSATIYYTKETLPRIKEWLIENWHDMKTISFLQYSGHGFLQAPYIPASKEEIEAELLKIKPITSMKLYNDLEDVEIEIKECEGSFCPTK